MRLRHQILLMPLLLILPGFASANYYALPIDEPGDANIWITSYFDHDNDVGEKQFYDGSTGYSYDDHRGVDYRTGVDGKEIFAADDGVVKADGWQNPSDHSEGYGYRIYLYHSTSSQRTVYGHATTTADYVDVNDQVYRGDTIILSGNTGESSGPHLHFGVYDCDCTTPSEQVDPFGWWQSTSDPWPYNANYYLWTTYPPSLAMASSAPATIASNQTWRGNYLIDGTVTVNSGIMLTIESGTVVKFKTTSSRLIVNGTLEVEGESYAPVYFTSYHDDTVGGDTNSNGTSTSPAAGDWRHVVVATSGVATLDHAIFRYGGNPDSNGSHANVYNYLGILTMTDSTSTDAYNFGLSHWSGTTTCTRCEFANNWNAVVLDEGSGSLTVEDSYIHDNGYLGVFANAGTVTLTDNRFEDHDLYGAVYVNYHYGMSFTHSGNTSTTTGSSLTSNLHGILTNGTQNASVTWTDDDMPYIVYPYLIEENEHGVRVPSGKTLTIDPGVVVKFASSTGSIAAFGGTISALGTSANPIVFTSVKDDSVAGDTNDDGASSGARGDWLSLLSSPDGNGGSAAYRYAIVRYGGGTYASYAYPLLYNGNSGTLTVASSTITESGYRGVLHAASGGSTVVNTSNITNMNNTYGMVSGQTGGSNAEKNYWGASNGPGPSGSGVHVFGVDYTPYATSWINW